MKVFYPGARGGQPAQQRFDFPVMPGVGREHLQEPVVIRQIVKVRTAGQQPFPGQAAKLVLDPF